ncbi:MAG: LamG-like jellyroll fold domain-containing protein [Opitutales bacterium]
MKRFRLFRATQCLQAALSSLATTLFALGAIALLFGPGTARLSAESSTGPTSGLSFDASPGRATLDSSFSLAGRSFTVEAWIFLNAAGGDRPVLAQVGPENLLHFLVRNNRLHLGFWNDDLTGATDVPTNEWVHVAYTYDAATRTQRLYLNGQNDGNRVANAPFAENNLPLHIGAYFDFSLNVFDGRMLELRIWDHARDAATLSAGRFATPPVDAPGLDALFTFTGVDGSDLPEATGRLIGNTLHGAVTVVEPVAGPAFLGGEFPQQALPTGSLAAAVVAYSFSVAPEAAFADPDGSLLTNGFGPARVWGTPWLETLNPQPSGIVVWEAPAPAITFQFSERVRVDGITLHVANSGGAAGIEQPTAVALSTPGGFAQNFAIAPGAAPFGSLVPIEIGGLQLYTDALTLTLSGNAPRFGLAEVSFDGAPLADPALQAPEGQLSLAAKRFLGLAPDAVDVSAIQLEVVLEEAGARFEFPRAADDFGVQAVVEWSTNLIDWQPLPHAPAVEPGRMAALLTPPPAEGRAFFRIAFPDGPPTVAGPGSFSTSESASPLEFALSDRLGVDSPLDPASLQLIAINDQALSTLGEPSTTANGGILQFLSDGTVRYTAAPGLPGGQVAEESFTYTVADRFGRTVRNTFTLTVVGENDPPTVGSFTGTHASTAVDAGVAYRYFTGSFQTEADFDTATPERTGRIPTIALDPADFDGSGAALEIRGELFVPASGPYTFYLTGNHGSVLDIGGTRVVDYDAADHTPERSGTIELTPGSHPIRLRYFDAVFTEGEAALAVEYSGPGFLREPIPANAFPRLADLPITVAADPDDGDVLRISHLNGIAVPEGEAAVLPSGATLLLAESGQITYRPAPGRTLLHEATDTDNFSFTVSDAGGLTASATAQLQLARQNSAPVAPSAINLNFPDGGTTHFAQVVASEVAQDADGDALRITHVNGSPLAGGSVRSLPSGAQVSFSTAPLAVPGTDPADPENPRFVGNAPFGLRFDAHLRFLFTLSQSGASDAFTITLTDAAGATADVNVSGSWIFWVHSFLGYSDSRFSHGAGLGPRSVWLRNGQYRFAHDVVTYITDRETGISYGHNTRRLEAGQDVFITFDLPAGIDLGGQHFFDRFDLEVDTLDGDPIYYFTSGVSQLTPLYSTATESFFEASAAINPRWGFDVQTVRGRINYKSGIHRIATDYGGGAQLFSGLPSLVRAASANKRDLEPTFAANITVQGVCRTRETAVGGTDIARFRIENRNPDPVPFTLGAQQQQTITVDAGQTAEIDVTYEPKIDVFIRETNFGLIDANEVTCPIDLDLTVTSLCSSSFIAFFHVRNNHPTDSFTVRVESLNFPSLRSEPMVIGNQSEEFIQLNPQGQNLGGTQGRLVVIFPEREEVVETFTFSNDPCD